MRFYPSIHLSPLGVYQPTKPSLLIHTFPYLQNLTHPFNFNLTSEHLPSQTQRSAGMATISSILGAAAVVGPGSKRGGGGTRVVKLINSFGGLKAHNNVVSLGLPVSTDQSFANIISSLKQVGPRSRSRSSGGALSSTCNSAIDEIFKISAIMPALVLVGVALGFVLLRIEAIVEEE